MGTQKRTVGKKKTVKRKRTTILKKRKSLKRMPSNYYGGTKYGGTKYGGTKDSKEEKEKKEKKEKKTVTKKRVKLVIKPKQEQELVAAEPAIVKPVIVKPVFVERGPVEEFVEKEKDIKVAEEVVPVEAEAEVKPEPAIMMASYKKSENVRLNEKFIELMDALANIMLKQGEPFRARAYQKAQETIMQYPDTITEPAQLKGMPAIGSTIMEKLNEYVQTGTLRVLEREKNNPINIIGEIYGVGPKKAKELVDAGIKSIEELRGRQELLNDIQRVGLKYYEDILQRIPRAEIDEYNKVFSEEVPAGAQYEIVGSYRRGAAESGDIDVIITSEDPSVFKKFVEALIRRGIILPDGVLSFGASKSLVVAKLPGAQYARRVDFLYSNPLEYPFAILYFTGSKIFNTVMRARALSLGYSLNEHGIYIMDGKKKGAKVDVAFATEKDIFDFLGMEYKEPRDRVSGMAVKPLAAAVVAGPGDASVVAAPLVAGPTKKVVKRVSKKLKIGDTEMPPLAQETQPLAQEMLPVALEENIKISVDAPTVVVEKKEKVVKEKVVKEKVVKEKKEKPEKKEKVAKVAKEKVAKLEKNTTVKRGKKLSHVVAVEKEACKPKLNLGLESSALEARENIAAFKKHGLPVLDVLTENQIMGILQESDKAFHLNKTPIMTDNEYDIVKDYAAEKYPGNPYLLEVGACVDYLEDLEPVEIEKTKVVLPYTMASMDKIKPDTGALVSWKQKYNGPYVLSCKLDGVSGMYSTEGGVPKLYTRGNGRVGQDISHLIPYLRLPAVGDGVGVGTGVGMVVRGEFVIPKEVFKAKYQDKFANPRNLVAGIVNRNSVDKEKVADLHFVAYEVIQPTLKPSLQMEKLVESGFETVLHKVVPDISNEMLSELLIDWRMNYVYEIDGVIVSDDNVHPRKTSGNPDHSFAFKMVLSDQIAEAKVVNVLWTPSKDGYLKPRVQIEPVHLGGVTITYATGFNGAFIQDNKIGVGAVIQIIRSGDVIPYIRGVTVPAAEAMMPNVPFTWNATHVDVMLEDASLDPTVREKNITGFFRGIGVEGLSSGIVGRIIGAGFDTVPAILKMSLEDFKKVESFGAVRANNIYSGIREKVENANLVTLMAASNLFGRGFSDKKLEIIMEAYPDILVSGETESEKIAKVAAVKGMAGKTAEAFVKNIVAFKEFLVECGLEGKLVAVGEKEKAVALDSSHPLFKKSVVLTGTRDKVLIERLKSVGAVLGSSVSKNTFAVVAPSLDEDTGKAADARRLGVPLFTPATFMETYGL